MCVLLLALLVHGGLGLKSSNAECNSALGLENLRIEDSQLTAQSHYESLSIGGGISVDTEPKCARLNKNNCAWCAPRGNGQYLQVDLRRNFTITGIATQGFEALSDYYVRRYKVCHSRDGHTWSILSQGMSGNHDGRSVVWHNFSSPVYTRYIRVYPLAYRYRICMRMELYGCSNFSSSLSTKPSPTTSGTNNTTPENLPITRTTAASSTEKLVTIHSTKDQTVQSGKASTPRTQESHPSESHTGIVAFHMARNDSKRHSKTWIIALVVVAIAVVIIIIISLLVRFYLPQRRKLFSRYRYPSNEIEVYLL